MRIRLPVGPEGHFGATPVRCDIAAQCRHLIGHTFDDECHRAMVDPRRHRFDTGAPRPLDHILGMPSGCQVDVTGRQPHQTVADCPSDDPNLAAIGIQQVEYAAKLRSLEPGLGGNGSHA
ncbi:hypothetical protein EMEDMD4_270164 [Sinorhizobium medicae]|uniref:Uncharacterized protein n=1 Tax=Sinorhizobium medicae TaxID=110321 RepID=A0A508WZK1_9HYPH|nr:hypothetical protein EMEDMD4_270164 [Sinorhizobium medicae]